jgi:branched-chain amino acid transport system ATP-binding protein
MTDRLRPTGNEPLLCVTGLRAGYSETEVLRDIDLVVGAGEVVALIGRNGVGKTTTLRAVTGAIPPTDGTVEFAGEDITDCSPVETVRRGLAVVPEERRVFPGLTVRENLELAQFGGAATGIGRDIDTVLEMFTHLSQNEHSMGATLSGGEQQMLAIARALVGGSQLLLLDEPTEGLAPSIVQRVEDLLAELNDDGMTILLVEQNTRVALNTADVIYVLDKGTVVHDGTPSEFRNDDQALLNRYLGVTGQQYQNHQPSRRIGDG